MSATQSHALPYRLVTPERLTSCVLFASPHSGRDYPSELLMHSVLEARRLRSSEDAFVDDLLEAVPREGAMLLAARLPRAWVDLNRGEDELDPALIEGLRRSVGGPRVAAGLGVIPRVVSGGRAIYSGKISVGEAETRLARVWRPYHARLEELMGDLRTRFGRAILLDMHSMPAEALETLGPNRPDVVLGDRYGTAARPATVAAIERVFTGLGLKVGRNTPFAGAYVAQRYGRPREGWEVVQIEIVRSLYMNEAEVCPSHDFPAFAAKMAQAVAGLAAIGRDAGRMAAE
ncbi:MAG: N-formylglutamate amidohydrolase [Paenirhodobacter sp.]|uniref:N-formylglutamate amidohydrolase n=1 Tax=Paenirhodobacter sp. TaxID=1965326 RepID=UPI003D10C3FE